MATFDLSAPESPEAVVAALRAAGPGGATPLAGGTDLLFDLDEGRVAPAHVLSLRRLPWRTLDWVAGALTVGSTLPLRALEDDPQVRTLYPGLYEAVRNVGSVALRQRATMGGNVVRSAPASDLIPILLALDAELDLFGPQGSRRLSVDRFVIGSRRTELRPDELVRSIRFPEPRPSAFCWQRVRPSNDISQVAVATAYSPSDRTWRVAVGGVQPRPRLLPEAARELTGPDPPPAAVGRAAAVAAARSPFVSDRRASEEYRRRLVASLVERAVGLTRPAPPRSA